MTIPIGKPTPGDKTPDAGGKMGRQPTYASSQNPQPEVGRRPDPRQLLLEIANCRIAKGILAGKPSHHPCQTIVSSQDGGTFQLPEPWVGQIDRAPILFISSNPSFDKEEYFPADNEEKWPPDRIVDFFQNRFTSPSGWVKGLKVLHSDGSYSKDWVRFWASARARTAEALEKKKDTVVPGVDFALTEVVHCKSKKQIGVEQAQDFCSKSYLERILSLAAARVLIVFGLPARGVICSLFAFRIDEITTRPLVGPLSIADIRRMLVFLPAPNEHGPKKSLEANLRADDLAHLREYLKGRSD